MLIKRAEVLSSIYTLKLILFVLTLLRLLLCISPIRWRLARRRSFGRTGNRREPKRLADMDFVLGCRSNNLSSNKGGPRIKQIQPQVIRQRQEPEYRCLVRFGSKIQTRQRDYK